MSLHQDLTATAEALQSMWPEADRRSFEQALADVRRSGVLEEAVQVGEMIPDFALTDAEGELIGLQELLDRGPVAVTFFLSAACPLCRLSLDAYCLAVPWLAARGASWIAVSTRPAIEAAAHLPASACGDLHLLEDLDAKVCGLFGLLFVPTGDLQAGYGRLSIPSLAVAGRPLSPLAGTYVVDVDGIAAFADVSADPACRPEPQAIIAALERLAAVVPGGIPPCGL